MPLIEITLMKRPAETKRRLIENITDCVAETLSVPPDEIVVVLRDTDPESYGIGGTPHAIRKGA